ncbi:hypothetical protein [Amycolatopsis taiwanensis]|uniref:hypothetical protein n=1 Tax=Amycolatopsis taiwanensis TaxID=342230 RepID=UPI0012ECB841|nr:hypothetical protein [Amycolatopsis taiwanensis]
MSPSALSCREWGMVGGGTSLTDVDETEGMSMQNLPRGATGFWDATAGPAPSVDVKAFRAACYEAARVTSAEVRSFTRPQGSTPNFYTAVLSYRTGPVAVVCHVILPLLATAWPPAADDSGPLSFIDVEQLAPVLSQIPHFRLLSASELRQPLARVDLSRLGDGEREQVRYWQPETVGAMLFNYWD